MATPEIAQLERQMLVLVNADRRKQGLTPLRFDERLADIARAHSWDMRSARFFSHTSPTTGVLEDRMDRAGYLAWEMRENLAVAESLERAEHNLLQSPGHRANIFAASVTHLGVGVVRGNHLGDPHGLIVTQVFARPAVLQSPKQAQQQLRALIAQRRRALRLPPLQALHRLDTLCADGLDELSDEVRQQEVAALGKTLGEELGARETPMGTLYIYGQQVLGAQGIELPVELGSARVRYLAIASAKARDERGRPRVKILMLLGEQR